MSASVLHQIADSVQAKLAERKAKMSLRELQKNALNARKPLPFTDAFFKPGIHAISEVKFKSPALGVLEQADEGLAVRIAGRYLQGGARAISVLTEEVYFHGSLSYLRAVRKAEPQALLLMKDFIVDEYQILEGLLYGADAILLIVALLGKDRTLELMKFARSIGLSVLVEVHDEPELAIALEIGAPLVGINNRNLKTLHVTLETSFELIKHKKAGVSFISESGIKTGQEMKALHAAGFSGFLIGSTLMSSGDPGDALKKILHESRSLHD